MSYAIDTLRKVDKFLDKLSKQQPGDAAAIEDAIEDLGDQPRPAGCIPVKGAPGAWRIRVGDYRICYTIDDGKLLVLVVVIGNRNDVYQVLRRHLGK